LLDSRDHRDPVAAYPADHIRADLLVATPEQAALATEHADDDLGWTPADDAQQFLLAQIEADRLAILDRIDTQQGGRDAEGVSHTPGGRSRPEDVDPAVAHALDHLLGYRVQGLVLTWHRATLCVL